CRAGAARARRHRNRGRGGRPVKRTFVYLAGLVGTSAAVYIGGQIRAQGPGAGAPRSAGGPGGAAPAANAGRDVAVFNVAKVMKDFQKWQFYANEMNKVRATETGRLGPMGERLAKLKADLEKDAAGPNRDAKEKEYKDLSRT